MPVANKVWDQWMGCPAEPSEVLGFSALAKCLHVAERGGGGAARRCFAAARRGHNPDPPARRRAAGLWPGQWRASPAARRRGSSATLTDRKSPPTHRGNRGRLWPGLVLGQTRPAGLQPASAY